MAIIYIPVINKNNHKIINIMLLNMIEVISRELKIEQAPR